MPERYRRAEDALADLIRENRRGTRDSQRATGTEKEQTAATVLGMVPVVEDALEQAQQAIEDAANALTTSSGKNSRRRGQLEPTPPPGGWVQGDQWIVDNADGVPVEVRVWDGAGFVPEQLLAAELLVLSGGLIRLANGVVTADAIAADAIDGMTITGALIRTAPTGQRMQFDVNGLSAFNSSGTLTAALYAATGGLSLNGSLYLITPGDPQDRVTLLTKSGISAGSGEQIAGSHKVSAGISPGLVTAQTRTPAVAPNIQPGSYACYLEANEHGATLRLDAQPPSETVSVAATSITAEVTDAKAQLVLKSVGDDGPPMFETAEASVLRLRQTDRFIVEGGRTESPVFATGVTGRRAEADADAIKWYTATGMKRSEIKDSASGLAITSDQVTLTTSGGVTVDGLLSLGSVLRGNASQMTWLSTNGKAHDGLTFWRTDLLMEFIYIGGTWYPYGGKLPWATARKFGDQDVAAGDVMLTLAAVTLAGGFTFNAADSSLVIPFTGMYEVSGNIYIWASSGSYRGCQVMNATTGDTLIGASTNSNWTIQTPKRRVNLTAGTKIRLRTSGDATNSIKNEVAPSLHVNYIGPSS